MSKIEFKEVKISDICDIISENHTYTKEYINTHNGEYPVYSATIDEPFGYIDNYDFDEELLIVVNYGDSGKTYFVNGKYCIGRNVCGLKVKDEYKNSISLNFIKVIQTPIFISMVKGQKQKNLNQGMVKNSIISIPIKADETFDLDTQIEVANKYEMIEKKKQELIDKKKEIKLIKINFINSKVNFKEIKIIDIFTPKLGDGKYTKKFCKDNQGEYPVYSGNTICEFAEINEYQYDGEYLTWAKDGLAGYLMIHNGKFSITNHRGILIPTENYKNIDLKYVKLLIEPIFRANKKGRLGINGDNEYTTLSKDMIKNLEEKILIPVKSDGIFDLDAQIEIAKKYEIIDTIKKQLSNKLDELINKTIIFN